MADATDLKSVEVNPRVGSNPTGPTILDEMAPFTEEHWRYLMTKEKPGVIQPMDNWKDQSTYACVTRRFFVSKEGDIGRCRRHAPVVEKGYPVVYATDWCGDHKMGRNPR